MTGFVCYNSAGAMTVSSDFTYPQIVDAKAVAATIDPATTGALGYNIDTPFGNLDRLGFLNTAFQPKAGQLTWFKLAAVNNWAFPGGWLFQNNVPFMRTSVGQKVTSGYLDVYNAAGTLVWSAVSAARMPRILGYMDIAAKFALDTTTATFNVPANAYILMNCIPGNISDDGTVVGYSGIVIKRSSATQVQLRYISGHQRNWAQSLQAIGLRIPYCVFPNIA